ncbi:hypothetical protein [Salirhabdus sp. Marseille-P4669]|uniref:hypothetical protein n=1 Tax=Salirhabdus sp. Marseille-P4669 TaxID=2042310 RepID=UPI000C7967B2|nr:hypothetical protein [Salirhabdus sp. Marseille-P4669]
MKDWWNRKRKRTRKYKKRDNHYTFGDFMLDVLLWIPELIVLPFRMVYWLLRGLGRMLAHVLDVF